MASILLTLRRLVGRLNPDQMAANRVVDDEEVNWLHPPKDLLDPNAWDQYWTDQLSHGLGPPLFDMFCNERPLIAAMSRHEMKRILCAGNGISMEPRALSAAGFDVVALDISARALEMARTFPPSDSHLMTFFDVGHLRPGGHVHYVVGDILDPTKSPGPFDVIIERRTAQNYLEPERARVLAALAARLSPQGIRFTHCHDARWKPPAKARHLTGEWCHAQGWSIWNGTGTKPDGRVAWLFTSTG